MSSAASSRGLVQSEDDRLQEQFRESDQIVDQLVFKKQKDLTSVMQVKKSYDQLFGNAIKYF